MKLNKKVLAVTAILAVGILAGCGSSNSTAGSAASAPASGVESSAASSEAAGETGDVLPIDAGDLNEIKTGSYKFAASITKVADGQATLSVYGYDSYLPEDIDALQEGSVLRTEYCHIPSPSEVQADLQSRHLLQPPSCQVHVPG